MSNQLDQDRIIGDDTRPSEVDTKLVDELLGQSAKDGTVNQQAKQVFTPKGVAATRAAQVKATVDNVDAVENEKVTIQRIQALERELKALAKGRDGVKLRSESEVVTAPIDFTKVSETDVFDLSVPMDAITLDLPDYIDVELKDTNYVPRWVNKIGRRLGPMMAIGWSYVTEQDLAGKLKLENGIDANGHIVLDDVILMKCQKSIYYGQLRRNYLRTRAMVNPKEAHQLAKSRVISDLKSAGSQDYDKYASQGKIDVYAPGFNI